MALIRFQASSQRKLGIIFFLVSLVVLGVLSSRVRMGSDDLEAYNLALNVPLTALFSGAELSTYDLAVLEKRWVWVLFNKSLIQIAGFFEGGSWAGIDLGYLLCSLFPAVAVWISLGVLILFFQERPSEDANFTFYSYFPTIVFFFSGAFVHFFNGIHVESFIILIFCCRLLATQKVKPGALVLLDVLLCSLKPYYAIIIFFEKIYAGNSFNMFRAAFYCIICFVPTLFISFYLNIAHGFSNNVNFDFNPIQIIENFYDINFSFGSGVFFCYPIFVLCIFSSFWQDNRKHKVFFAKLCALFALELFLSTVPFWHGGAPGNRYLAPAFIILYPEFLAGYRLMLQRFGHPISVVLCVATLLSLPILEYKNTSLHEYSRASASSGVAVGYIDNDRDFFPVNDVLFNPIVFSNSIIFSKILGASANEFQLGRWNFDTQNVYPTTILARLKFVARSDFSNSSIPSSVIAFSQKYYQFLNVGNLLYYLLIIVLITSGLRRGD